MFLKIWTVERDTFQREIASVTRVIESHQKHLLSEIERYAASNAAYVNIDTNYSAAWVEERFSHDLAAVSDYSVALLINPDLEIVYTNFTDPGVANNREKYVEIGEWDAIDDIRKSYVDLITSMPENSTNFSIHFSELSRVQIIECGDQLAIAAAFAIVPDPGNIPISQRAPYILIAVHLLDDDHLDGILSNLSLADLVIAKSIAPDMNGILLIDQPSDVPAYLAWHPMTKGTSILRSSAPVLFVTISLISFIALFSIRQRARVRIDLEESERQLRDAHRIAKMGGFELSSDNIFTWRDEVLQIYGADSTDSLSHFDQFCSELVHPDDVSNLRASVEACWTDHQPVVCEFRTIHPNGQTTTLRMQAQVLNTETGREPSLVGMVHDITDFKLLADKLRQSQKMEAIGNLTGGIAHDFNNLLAVILGNLELMDDTSTPEERAGFIEDAMSATLRAADLTRNMLTFARKAPLAPKPLDLNQIVKNTKNWAVRVLPKTIDVETPLLDGLWPIEADPGSTENTLLNLILNARDGMPNGGKLTIKTDNVTLAEQQLHSPYDELRPGRYVMLAITDTGTGIASASLEHIFEPFFTTKEPGEGTGLGLAAVQGFMKQSGGMVLVSSELGQGTTFKLYFPALGTPSKPEQIKTKDNSAHARILVVEDAPDLLDLLVTMLEQANYVAIPAGSGHQAIDLFDAIEQVDLLLTDVVMPGQVQGPELARLLSAKQPDLRVVFMSGHSDKATVHGNMLCSKDISLTKPVKRTDLFDAIEKVLT